MTLAPLVPFESLYVEPSKNGVTRPKRIRGNGYKMINMGELFAHDRIKNPPMDLVPMSEAEMDRFGIKEGDLLFARQSLIAEGAGKCSIVLAAPEPTTFESHLIRVRLNPKVASPLYFYYYFSSPAGKGNVQSLVMQVAAAGIRGSELATLPVPKPEITTQRRVASILSAYDDLIENNTRRIAILEEMARCIYEEWFVRFRFPGHESVRMVESELGLVPEGWEQTPLGSLLSHHIGGGWGQETQSEEFVVPAYVIRGTDIPDVRGGSLGRSPLRYHTPSNYKKRKLEGRDIVFEVSGGSKDQPVGRAVMIGEKFLARASYPIICASFCRLVRADASKILPELLHFHFQRIYANRQIMQYQTQSTGITNFKFAVFLEKELVLRAPSEIQDQFMAGVGPMLELAELLGVKNSTLRTTRDLLLPKLISGELDVSRLPEPDPA